ncbi:MAG: NAD(P)-dependent oxidoreductase [Nanoarchaeota archaeon]
MNKIVITGANGTIGSVLRKGFKNKYQITGIDLPEVDIRDYNELLKVFHEKDVIIHLAWNAKYENFRSERIDTDNIKMADNVYRCASEKRVKRVVMASSIHADYFYEWNKEKDGLLSPEKLIGPDSPYGASKIFIESLGRYHANSNRLEVICLRFGGVNQEDEIDKTEEGFDKVWLSHNDCVSLVERCIESSNVENNFQVIYGVSNNSSRIHNNSNKLGWIPKDNSEYK